MYSGVLGQWQNPPMRNSRKPGMTEASALSGNCQGKKLRSQYLVSVWTHEALSYAGSKSHFIESHEIRGEQINIL